MVKGVMQVYDAAEQRSGTAEVAAAPGSPQARDSKKSAYLSVSPLTVSSMDRAAAASAAAAVARVEQSHPASTSIFPVPSFKVAPCSHPVMLINIW